MISTQVLTLFLVIIVPCASQHAPGFGCNDTFLMVELHKCEKTMLQALIDDPSANCREEVKKLQQCSRKLIVDRCYSSLYALYPKLREAVEKMMDVTLKQVNKASFYCSDHKMKINWEMIPNAVKKVLPCDKRFFEESLQCAEKFRAAFNKNKKDPDLCRLYTETKRCSHRISYIYCTSSSILSVNKLNPFCEGGRDIEEPSNDMTIKKKPLKCMVHVCSNSSSSLFPTPPCAPPQEITCATPKGLPFEYDACMTSRITLEPVEGVTVTQVNRNCSSSFLCKYDVFCSTANSTGAIQSCNVNCCKGELCNKDNSYQTKIQPTESEVSSFKCISSACTKSSSPLFPPQCGPEQEITCNSPRTSVPLYDRCITSRVSMGSIAGITVEQEIRNCSYSLLCESELFCKAVNKSGLVTRCDIQCCEGNLCNRKRPIKTTPIPQTATPKVFSPLTKTAIPTKPPKRKPLKCMVYSCSNSSSSLFAAPSCAPPRELTCATPEGLPFEYDACITTRVVTKPIAGLIVEQEMRNCSSSFQCQQPKLFCDMVNTTGLLKKCDVHCCKEDLCNKKETKATLAPQSVTQRVSSPPTKLPKEYRPKFQKGVWTKVTPSWISGHLLHGVRVKYRRVNNALVIEGHVTSYGCHRRPGSGLTTFIRGNWTRILYTQEFMGSASCWRIFGSSGRKGGYKQVERSGLEEFDTTKGDIIFNELKMGGKDRDAFNGITYMCGQPAKNFWHAQNGQALRRATVMLRRKTDGSKAGIHTATSCGQPSFIVKDIFVYH
ncbi:uncharacterized protein LOC116287019 [Actinia tenebrosa]|uniref:Uncharacterized protein LOC116287019 n=1 Tax=Actinia tenebrosa TaxID=6105 RepID=A0A6P8H259_ACTTE|nr:uncharacterized protein LOC116287019 [Actinia tenebrosa]